MTKETYSQPFKKCNKKQEMDPLRATTCQHSETPSSQAVFPKAPCTVGLSGASQTAPPFIIYESTRRNTRGVVVG